MKVDLKVRDLKAENRHSLILNIFLLVVTAFMLWIFIPGYNTVGTKNELILNMLFALGITCFSVALEKYSVIISGTSEKIVINVLSALYMLICMIVLDILFFNYRDKYISDIVFAAMSVIVLSIADYLHEKASCNPKKFRKPRLLIIASSDKAFMRMKRIKYGALSAYDSWYENLAGMEYDNFRAFIKERFAEFDAICIFDGLSELEYNAAVKTAMNLKKDLFIVPDIIDVGKTNAKQVRFDDVLTLYMPKHYISRTEFFAKRTMDLIISIVAFIIAAIPMLFIALAIKLTSPGPVFYKQERMTKDKKRFMIYKFRTMIPDAEKLTGPKFAEKDDPRITKIGKILRSCRLDELPQILNILKGDMSVVGPRPERPVFIERFEKEIDNYDYRFAVKAGLTSLSHVYGRYSTYIHDRTYYDLFYITNYSILLDLKIILLTSKTMFIKSAAEGEDDFKEKTSAENVDDKIKEEANI